MCVSKFQVLALQALTKLPATCPWCKICLLCDNYLSEPKTRVGGKGIAGNWGEGHIEEIVTNASTEELEAIEAMPPLFFDAYSRDRIPNVPEEIFI